MKTLRALIAALALGSCGSGNYLCSTDTDCDTANGRVCVTDFEEERSWCGTLGERQQYEQQPNSSPEGESNPCGNSPMYGQHLWNFTGCEGALHMREDCVVEGTAEEGRAGYEAFPSSDPSQFIQYSGLEILDPAEPDPHLRLVLDPNFRFPERDDDVTSEGERANDLLDSLGGYVYPLRDGKDDFCTEPEDCPLFLIVMPYAYPGEEECKASPYYLGN